MNKPKVDALAALRQARRELPGGSQNGVTLVCSAHHLAAPLDAAIDALTELVEAAKRYRSGWWHFAANSPEHRRRREELFAALARLTP